MTEKDYTFLLSHNSKTRHIAGKFDIKTRKPRYEIEVNVPSHVKNQVEVNQIMLGTPEDCRYAWDINNKSNYPVFITIKEDGVIQQI
ncbi:MAG: hypothetical protein KKF30_07585 [Proteobacteria bacterium]|nr:hypothetical protein [Pseudomonadota bacterium]MBU4470270.1 hypothetical protein [Pseudomonadota bacterium]MCG2752684.1 hypothetical protein [Desulfobacteraceae bacterium]